MATKAVKKAEGDTSVRSKVVGVRLDPKLRYLAELAARKQRRSLSSFIEWAVEESLSRVLLHEGTNLDGDVDVSIADRASELWDVDDAERFARLALFYEDLLTHEEQILWKIIKDTGLMWVGRTRGNSIVWNTMDRDVFPQLRKHWKKFLAVAKGEASPDDLPTWRVPDLQPIDKDTDSPFDDDIPF